MLKVRMPAVAGGFYPRESVVLRNQITAMVRNARGGRGSPMPKALILPHAGYKFSGAVAAQGMALLPLDNAISRVVIVSPSHRKRVNGVALPSSDAFGTPLGAVPVDQEALGILAKQSDIQFDDEAHVKEHGIEVILPFLQMRLKGFSIVPLVVGQISPERMGDILDTLWGDEETLIVISSDLSHYMDEEAAEKIDLETAGAIELLRTDLTGTQACGAKGLAGFLHTAQRRGLRVTRHDLTHSGKTAGNPERVVGYGCWSAIDPLDAQLCEADRNQLLRVSAKSMMIRAKKGKPPSINLETFSHVIQGMGASFVTLEQNKRLRGCIGSLKAHRPLVEDVIHNAIKSGFHDPRFQPMTEYELPSLDMEIAYLSAPAEMTFTSQEDLLSQLVAERDGLIIQDGKNRGTFLPKVWESLDTPEKFLNGLKLKAKLPKDHWSDTVKVWRYTTERFSESFESANAR